MTDWFKAGGHKFCVAENAEEELDEWGLDFMEEEGGDDDHEDGKAADVQNLQRVEDRSDVKSLLLETQKSLEAEITNAVVPETAEDEVAGLVFFTILSRQVFLNPPPLQSWQPSLVWYIFCKICCNYQNRLGHSKWCRILSINCSNSGTAVQRDPTGTSW